MPELTSPSSTLPSVHFFVLGSQYHDAHSLFVVHAVPAAAPAAQTPEALQTLL